MPIFAVITIMCDICLGEFEERDATRLISPVLCWSAAGAKRAAEEDGWMIEKNEVNCPGCFEKQLGLPEAKKCDE